MLVNSDRGVEVMQWKSEVRLTPVDNTESAVKSTEWREAPEVKTDHPSGTDKKRWYLSDIVIFFSRVLSSRSRAPHSPLGLQEQSQGRAVSGSTGGLND